MEEGFEKHCGKRRKYWQPAFSPFPTVFSALSRREIVILTTPILSSANASNLDQAKILVKCFILYPKIQSFYYHDMTDCTKWHFTSPFSKPHS